MTTVEQLWVEYFKDQGWEAKYIGESVVHCDFKVDKVCIAISPSSNKYRKNNKFQVRPPQLVIVGKPLRASWWWYNGKRENRLADGPLPNESLHAYLIRHDIT